MKQPKNDLERSRWVLITGGARRLGHDFCLEFARAGWHVVCHYRSSQSQMRETQAKVRALGRRCIAIEVDLALSEAASTLLEACVRETSVIPQCIVNNASIFENDTAFTTTAEHLAQHFQINTVTPLLLANALAARVKAQASDSGVRCVIHVLDQKVHNLNPDYFSYTVSKLALERSVALQAQALAPWVRVCGLSPGLVYLSGTQTPDNFAQAACINLQRHPISVTDVAKAAVFLAENSTVNGCVLQADNGQHLVALECDVMFAIGPRANS